MMKRLLPLFFLCAFGAYGQSLFRYENVLINQSGIPIVGANVWVCSGNVTPNFGNSPPCSLATVYSDLAGTLQISQPLISTTGSPTQVGSFAFVVAAGTYTLAVKGAGVQASDLITVPNTTGTTTANNLLGPGSVTGTFSGSPTFSGNPIFTGNPTLGNSSITTLNASTIFADQLSPSGGLCSVSGTDASAKIQCAINLLPANGGVVNAVNLQDGSGTGSTVIDPGAKSVTLYLGCYTYQIQQVVLESNFRIYGCGMGSFTGGGSTTILQQNASFGTTNMFVLGTQGGHGGAIQGVLLDSFRVYGTSGNAAIGLNLKTVNGSGTGLWYSTFRNLCIGACGPGIAGFNNGVLVFDGTVAGTLNQFIDLYNVQAFRGTATGFSLNVTGANGQIIFNQCQFDGPARNDGSTTVQLANTSGNTGPYSITFNGSTVQHATLGVSIAGAQSVTFINTHFETVGEAIQINTGVSAAASTSILFMNSTCQNFCGNNTGTGWWAKNLSPASGTQTVFIGNQIQQSADAFYVGFSNFQGFASFGDEESTAGTVVPLPNIGMNIPIPVAFTTTAVTSESVTVTGATASSHCWAEATNATAAGLTGVFLSAPTTNAVTINHSATSGGTFNVFCTPN